MDSARENCTDRFYIVGQVGFHATQLLPEAISLLDGSSTVENQEFRFWGGSCAGFLGLFGPKGVFWCKDNVQKVS